MSPLVRRIYDLGLLLFVVTVALRRHAMGSEIGFEGRLVVLQGLLVVLLTGLHAGARLGFPRSLILAAVAVGISLPAEWLGATRGWVFGAYDYTDLFRPRVWGVVPLLIPVAWYILAYLGDALAGMALPDRAPALARVAFAALAVTSWDFLFDPICVALGAWTWEGGGAYFGVIPLSNFVGWFGVASVIHGVYYVLARPVPSDEAMAVSDPVHYLAPLALYGALTGLMAAFALRLGLVGEAVVGVAVALPFLILATSGYVERRRESRTEATIA